MKKTLLIGIILLLLGFVLKIVLIAVILKLCGVEVGGILGKIVDFFGIGTSGFLFPLKK